MSYHTLGPWHAVSRNRVNRNGVPLYDIMAGKGNPENWDMVADRVDGEANAQLIASAPDLLETLRGLVDALEPYIDSETDSDIQTRERGWLDQARAAIAKATKGE